MTTFFEERQRLSRVLIVIAYLVSAGIFLAGLLWQIFVQRDFGNRPVQGKKTQRNAFIRKMAVSIGGAFRARDSGSPGCLPGRKSGVSPCGNTIHCWSMVAGVCAGLGKSAR